MALNFRTLRADEIECRIGQISKDGKGLSLLLYKDARCDMTLLDETVGAMNWKRSHSRENANCTVSIWDGEKNEWVSKEDTGTESNTEAEKGLASDSFKRACVNWGIGRELYTSPFIWITSDKANITGGKCYDRFKVKSISYDENRTLNQLEIVNEKSGEIVFTFPNKPVRRAKTETPVTAAQFVCDRCHGEIVGYTKKDGGEMTAAKQAEWSYGKFGKTLCKSCCVMMLKGRDE